MAGCSRSRPASLAEPFECPEEVKQVAPEVCENEQKLLVARRDNFTNKLSGPEIALDAEAERTRRSQGQLAQLNENLAISDKEAELVVDGQARPDGADRTAHASGGEGGAQRADRGRQGDPSRRSRLRSSRQNCRSTNCRLQLQQEALDELTQSLAELSVVEETIRGATDRVKQHRHPLAGRRHRQHPGAQYDRRVRPARRGRRGHRADLGDASGRGAGFAERRRLHPGRISSALIKITAYDFSIFGGIGRQGGQHHGRQPGRSEHGRAVLSGAGGDGPGRRWRARANPTRSSRAWSAPSRS